MPNLQESLQICDLGHLRIVAGFWGLDLTSSDPQEALQQLVQGMLVPDLVTEIVESLPVSERGALSLLQVDQGRLPWSEFVRRFGEMRPIGSGRRDREQAHLHPASTTEVLFYRGLLARAFFETPTGLQEFAYIPADLILLIPVQQVANFDEPGHPASPQERAYPIPATDAILDDACTFLAAIRLGWNSLPGGIRISIPETTLLDLFRTAGLIHRSENGSQLTLNTDQAKDFLAGGRGNSLLFLVSSWLKSQDFNDLHHVPGLVCEGTWKNDPLATRQFAMEFLPRIPVGKWWSLAAFIRYIQVNFPDFQRPAGDFDSWLIRSGGDGAFLHGFEHWEQVDGALLRYLISAPLHWLGIVDLAASTEAGDPTAFRLTAWSEHLLHGKLPAGLPREEGKLHISANGRIAIPRLLPRSARYQVARFSEWEPEKAGAYQYHLTPASLKSAQQQGLKIPQLISILKKHAASPLPPAFIRSLNRWELNGSEARLEQPMILKLNRPEVLDELRKSPANRFLGEVLGPLVVTVKPGARKKVLAALAELGLLVEEVLNKDIMDVGEKHHE